MDKEKLASLSRPHKLCMNCNAPIDGVDRHPSVVRSADKELERYDYCPACWEHIKGEMFDSFWLTRREPRQRRAPKLNRRQRRIALRALFESLRDRSEDQDLGAHLFLIAHLLMQWGGLQWRENARDAAGEERILFEDPLSGETFEIPSVDIDDERLVAIKTDIEDFLRDYAPDPDAEVTL